MGGDDMTDLPTLESRGGGEKSCRARSRSVQDKGLEPEDKGQTRPHCFGELHHRQKRSLAGRNETPTGVHEAYTQP